MALIYWAHAGSPGDGTDGRWWEQTKATKDCVCISLRKVSYSYYLLVQFTNELRWRTNMLNSILYTVSVPVCFWLLVIVFDFLFILPVKKKWSLTGMNSFWAADITRKRSNSCYSVLHTYYIINKKVMSPPNIDEVHYNVVTLSALTYYVSH